MTTKKGRVSKRTSGKNVGGGLRAAIKQEVRSAIMSGESSERKKVTMELSLPESGVYMNGKERMNSCIRVPITTSLPSMAGAGDGPDVRRRESNAIMLTGVNVRISLSVSDETRFMMLLYEPGSSVQASLDRAVPVKTIPSAADGYVPEQMETALVPFEMLGLVSKDGPFMVKKFGKGILLDSADGTVFESRLSTHSGKPIGPVVRKKFGQSGLRRTLNWNQSAAQGVGLGYTAWNTVLVNEWVPLKKKYTYMYEMSNEQAIDRNAEVLLYIDCPSEGGALIPEGVSAVGARIRNVVVDLYYHDVTK